MTPAGGGAGLELEGTGALDTESQSALTHKYMSAPFDLAAVGGGALLPPPPSSLLASLCFHASSLALAFSKLRCRLRFFSSRKHCRGASS